MGHVREGPVQKNGLEQKERQEHLILSGVLDYSAQLYIVGSSTDVNTHSHEVPCAKESVYLSRFCKQTKGITAFNNIIINSTFCLNSHINAPFNLKKFDAC